MREYYRVDNFLLSDEWNKEPNAGRISYVFKSFSIDGSLGEHESFVEEKVKEILDEKDDNYTSWVETSRIFKELYGSLKYVTVVNFRVRDAG